MGLVSPLGQSVDRSWQRIMEGKSGIGRISYFDASGYPCQVAAEVKDFFPEEVLDPKTVRRYDRSITYGLYAAREAILQAGLEQERRLREETGVLISPGIGSIRSIEQGVLKLYQNGHRRLSPYFMPGIMTNMVSGLLAIEYGFKGPSFSVVSACASGNHSIGEGYWLLQRDEAKAMIVGGTDAAITPVSIAGFTASKSLSTFNDPPERSSRPFDVSRNGFVIGEGAAVLVLEPLEQALSRGTQPLAEVVGYGLTSDAYHITAPSPEGEGAYRSMAKALEHAGLGPSEIGYINAHATGTPIGDRVEVKAIVKLFGQKAPPTSSTKSMMGHLLGAAGAVEAIVTIQSLRNQILPPTLHLEQSEPDDPLDHVPEARPGSFEYSLSNSFGFGSTNATLLFRRWS